jgi:predicted RNA-binding protein (virulence factor B family)
MEKELKIGEYNHLRVIKEVDFGLYLDGYEDEILLPKQYVKEGTQVDDIIKVFIYRDSEDRIIATTLEPKATIDQFAFLEVKDVSKAGVFLEWGLMKDLLVPFGEQKGKMVVGKSYLVYVYLDPQTDRIVASARIEKFLPRETPEFSVGEKVSVIPYEYTDMGINCLINNCKLGLLFKNQLITNVKLGQSIDVYISNIRADYKIDLSMKYQQDDKFQLLTDQVLAAIKSNNGHLYLGDKSSPEAIYDQLKLSKKDFKRAIGALYKSKIIQITPESVSLL